MGYFKKGMIRRVIIAGVLVFSLTYCGSTAVSDKREISVNETANALKSAEGEGDTSKRLAGSSEASENEKLKKEGGTSSEITKNNESEGRVEISCTSERPSSDIPVYRAKNQDKVKEYLAGLPSRNLTYEEAEERGLIQRIWRNSEEDHKQRERFDKQWLDFYEMATRQDLKWNAKKWEAYHDLAFEKAVVILSYTVEGDPIYDYISCVNGNYYFYSDNSRDKYGSGSYDGSYKNLRVIQEKDEDGKEYSSFYLVKDRKMTNKEIKKMIHSEEGYDIEDLNEVYALDYVLEGD